MTDRAGCLRVRPVLGFLVALVFPQALSRGAMISTEQFATATQEPTSAALVAAPRPLQVLPLGDSITWGFERDLSHSGGYRTRLFQRLQADGRAVKFIGSVIDPFSPTLTKAGQAHHEGHGGYTMTQIYNNLTGSDGSPGNNGGRWLDATATHPRLDPDVILLHIGTNDILRKTIPTRDTLRARLDALISRLVNHEPQAYLLVAGIIPIDDDPTRNNLVKLFNSTIRDTLIPKYTRLGKKVRYVDQYSRFVGTAGPIDARLPDNVHPDQIGYSIMGDRWFDAIKALPIYRPPTALVSAASVEASGQLGAEGASVPEPTGVAIMLMGGVVVLMRRRRQCCVLRAA